MQDFLDGKKSHRYSSCSFLVSVSRTNVKFSPRLRPLNCYRPRLTSQGSHWPAGRWSEEDAVGSWGGWEKSHHPFGTWELWTAISCLLVRPNTHWDSPSGYYIGDLSHVDTSPLGYPVHRASRLVLRIILMQSLLLGSWWRASQCTLRLFPMPSATGWWKFN